MSLNRSACGIGLVLGLLFFSLSLSRVCLLMLEISCALFSHGYAVRLSVSSNEL